MFTRITRPIEKAVFAFRSIAQVWWGGIGCRIAFMMFVAILLVSAMIGLFLLWEGKRGLEAEMRSRSLFIGSYFSALAAEDIVSEDRRELYRKLSPAFLAQGETSRDIQYLIVYNHAGKVLSGNMPGDIVEALEPDGGEGGENAVAAAAATKAPVFRQLSDGAFELMLPVTVNGAIVGYVRLGISGGRYQKQFTDLTKKTIAVSLAILVLGLIASQIIAAGILRPISRLNAAVDELAKQNWKTPIPVRGRDELSKLATAFNEMAHVLKDRETSLSRGNRDLFILHTSGLDLMESLNVGALIEKIAARTEDLLKADTTAISVVDRETRQLQYLGVVGSKERMLRGLDLPIEAGGIYNWLASYGTPLLIPDASKDFRLDGGVVRALGISSLIAVPLWSSSTMIAVMTAINKKGGEAFDKHDLRLFTVFSNLAGAALQNAFLYDDLRSKMAELEATQQQLVRSTKMAAIGELAANVAHEINNPLTSVLGYTSHLLKTLALPEESRAKLQLMEQETLRVRKIIRNLLDFSRQRPSRMRPGDILQPLRETVSLLQGLADRSGVRIVENYPPNPVTVKMDHNELKQVFINLMNNAIHSMPDGGEISISVSFGQDGGVTVEMADTGHGIAQEHMKRIFEPFFTTKSSGDGTGLGLSISYRIIQNHSGKIDVESSPGKGSLFRVTLPTHNRAAVSYG